MEKKFECTEEKLGGSEENLENCQIDSAGDTLLTWFGTTGRPVRRYRDSVNLVVGVFEEKNLRDSMEFLIRCLSLDLLHVPLLIIRLSLDSTWNL